MQQVSATGCLQSVADTKYDLITSGIALYADKSLVGSFSTLQCPRRGGQKGGHLQPIQFVALLSPECTPANIPPLTRQLCFNAHTSHRLPSNSKYITADCPGRQRSGRRHRGGDSGGSLGLVRRQHRVHAARRQRTPNAQQPAPVPCCAPRLPAPLRASAARAVSGYGRLH